MRWSAGYRGEKSLRWWELSFLRCSPYVCGAMPSGGFSFEDWRLANCASRKITRSSCSTLSGMPSRRGSTTDIYAIVSDSPLHDVLRGEGMSIPGLTIIGESINDSVPSTHVLFEGNDLDGIVELARQQAAKGAAYIDVNVGPRSPGFMAAVIRKIQEHIPLPLSIDTPDPALAAAALDTYDAGRAGHRIPILNSITEARLEMFDMYTKHLFKPILLVTEGVNASGEMILNTKAENIHATAKSMVNVARTRMPHMTNDQVILDPGIMPIGSDAKGDFRRLMDALALIHQDNDLAGVHMSVGLSNFTAMLPSKRADGSPAKGALESAFLTMAMPMGLDIIIGSVKRQYSLLTDEDPALQCLKDVLKLEGVEAVMRVMLYLS
jgi:cobalamin-dependent methionine synthase I